MFELLGFFIGLSLIVLGVIVGHLVWRFTFEAVPWLLENAPPFFIVILMLIAGLGFASYGLGVGILRAVKP